MQRYAGAFLLLLAVCLVLSVPGIACEINDTYKVIVPLNVSCPVVSTYADVDGWKQIYYMNLTDTQIKLMKAGPKDNVYDINFWADTTQVISDKGAKDIVAEPINISGRSGVKATGNVYSAQGSIVGKGIMVGVPLRNDFLLAIISRDEVEVNRVLKVISVEG